MVFQKLELLISPSPILIKSISFFCFQIIVMICGLFRLIISSLLSDYFSTLFIKHSLLSYTLDSIIVLITLLLLRYRLTIFVLSCAVLEVTFTLHFTIGTHRGGAYERLANIWPFFPWFMKSPVNVWKVHHLFKRISHESIWENIISHA